MLDARPEMDGGAMDVVECWHQCSSARYMGPVAAGPIPYQAISEWATRRGISGPAFWLLVDVIGELDVDRAERLSSEMRTREKQREQKGKRR